MALPTLDKTWIFKVNQLYISTTSNLVSSRTLHLAIKQILTDSTGWTDSDGYATTNSYPWIVAASSGRNGATSDSGTIVANTNDNWDTIYDLVWANAGSAHSWIVLRQPQINANFEICMDCVPVTNTYYSQGFVSHAAGFDLSSPVNTAAPTATDMITHFSGSSNITGYTGAYSFILGCMMSTDGECTRLFMMGSSTPRIFWLFDKPKNPVSGWTNPSIALMTALNGSSPVTYGLTDTAYISGIANSLPMWMYATTEFYISAAIGQYQLYENQISGEWPITPIGLASDTTGCKGRHGEIYDWYFTCSVLYTGTAFPDTGPGQFIVIGDTVLPWNKSNFIIGL